MGSFLFKIIFPIVSLFGFSQKNCKVFYEQAQRTTYDVIIVPGVPYRDHKWDTIMKGRVYWAKHLYEKGITRHIMFSGSSVYTPYYEAKIMGLYAKAIGIPDSVIFEELKAEHSVENVYYGYKLSMNHGFKKIALASDPFQCKRMQNFISKHSLIIDMVPFVKESLKGSYKVDPLIPDSLACNPDFISIRDRESCRMRRNGTRGKNINTSYYEDGRLE